MTPAVQIGSRLRRAREERGVTLRDLACRTKLSVVVLQAIERNDMAALPGGLYPKAYVRMLAAEVGLDVTEMARQFAAEYEPQAETVPAAPRGRLGQLIQRYLDRWHRPT